VKRESRDVRTTTMALVFTVRSQFITRARIRRS